MQLYDLIGDIHGQAAKQADELILSYTNLFDAKGLKLLCNLVHLGNAETPNNGEVLRIE
jgi:hypothetical protein